MPQHLSSPFPPGRNPFTYEDAESDHDPRLAPVSYNRLTKSSINWIPEPMLRRSRPGPTHTCYHEGRLSGGEANLYTVCGSRKHVHTPEKRNRIPAIKPGDKNYGRVEEADNAELFRVIKDPVDFRRYCEKLPPLPSVSPIKRRAKKDREDLRKSRESLRSSVRALERWTPGLDPEELNPTADESAQPEEALAGELKT
mmetsp:Transcript_15144/g.29174  ORF Transcript_15144/g.29174 Transcript_15144/m.29174 type:complete len:198 (-) Transcript_15144:44-637(-)